MTTNLQSLEIYLGLLITMAKQGVKVRILTLHPGHEFISKRFIELGFSKAKSFSEEMIVSIKHFCRDRERRLTKAEQQNFEIRLYKNPPTLMLFRRDHHIIVSFILQQGRARDQLHIEFNALPRAGKPNLSKAFIDHFEIVWEKAEVIDIAQSEQLSADTLFPSNPDQNSQ